MGSSDESENRLYQLVEEWREEGNEARRQPSFERTAEGHALTRCADELEEVLDND